MATTSSNRRAYSSATGRVAEVRFVRAARNKGLLVTKATAKQDMHDHVDYWLAMTPDGRKWGVDVKGNNLPDEIWCEFKNVRGNPGWMYGGATIIAFDMPEEGGFSIVDREELAFFCEKHVKPLTKELRVLDAVPFDEIPVEYRVEVILKQPSLNGRLVHESDLRISPRTAIVLVKTPNRVPVSTVKDVARKRHSPCRQELPEGKRE